MKRLGASKRGEKEGGAAVSSEWSGAVSEEVCMDFSAEELSEFLEADLHGVEADPQFREDLREKRWTMVSNRLGGGEKRGE
jgi:hypothetical protein